MTTGVSTFLRMRSTKTPPTDILRSILFRLPVKSLLRLQSVCKEWRSLIQDSHFRHSYSHKERLIVVSDRPWYNNLNGFSVSFVNHNFQLEKLYDFPVYLSFLKETYFHPRRILGSCNGLVLLSAKSHIFLWNPSTRDFTKVLEHECLTNTVRILASGFCYDSSRGDYTAILLLPHFVIVARLRQKEWRQVSFPYDLPSRRASLDSLHFRNIFHLVLRDVRWQDNSFSGCEKIVYFDLDSEKFELLPTPKVKEGGIDIIGALGIIEGCLSMALYKSNTIEILAMKEYGVAESWVTLYTVSQLELLVGDYWRVTFYSLKNNVLIWHWGDRQIFTIDMMTKERENVLDGIRDENIVLTCLHVESLASPHEYTWIDEQHKQFSKKIKGIGPNLRK